MKLQKTILMEEKKRWKRNSQRFHRLLWSGAALLLILFATAFYHWNVSPVPQLQYERGAALFRSGKYRRAYRKYLHLYEEHPEFHLAPQALLQAAEILQVNLKRDREALLTYLLVQRDYPGHPLEAKALQRAAEIYKYRLAEYDRALTAYQKLLDSSAAGGDEFQYEIADIYFRQNNFEQARIEFENLLKNHPETPRLAEVLFRVASLYALEGALKEAAFVYQRVVDECADSPFYLEALYGMALVSEERGELQTALNLLEKLQGRYRKPAVLKKRIQQVQERINTKRKAI